MAHDSKIIDRRTVTADSLAADRAACPAADQRRQLEVGCQTWGILYAGGRRGQMTRWPSGRGAIATGPHSVWGEWSGAEVLVTDDGDRHNEYGELLA